MLLANLKDTFQTDMTRITLSTFFLPRHTIVRVSVRPSIFSFPDEHLSRCQWSFNKLGMCMHWYCRNLVWDSWWAKFVNFWRRYLPAKRPYLRFWMIALVNINRFYQTWYVHWYCKDLVWECRLANFINFCYLHATRLYFHFRTITLVKINGFSPNLVRALILWRSGLGANGYIFNHFLTNLSVRNRSVFSFTTIILVILNGFSPNLICA